MKNRFLFIAIIAISFFSNTVTYAQEKEADLQQLRVDVVYLSSDLLMGRETGSEGEALAAQYIATRLGDAGAVAAGQEGSWFHTFDFSEKANPHVAESEAKEGRGKNVVGFIDNGAEQTIAIGAHYDHLGLGGKGSGSLHVSNDDIHNGADDNASGIAVMLYLAEKLKSAELAGNNYLFIGFSGEEKGLFGSKAYVNAPTIELSTINYMINMDMVGRLNDEKTLVINGAGTSPVWKEKFEAIAVDGIQVKTTDSGIGPSDHTSFYLKDIPAIHFFTGQHKDYHKPGDDAHKVNYEGMLSVGNYILELIRELDGSGEIEFTKTKDANDDKKVASFKVTLGVMPDYTYSGEGMRIDAVMDDRPAAKGGLEDGDIIIKLGDVDVKDIYAYMEALSKFKKGDTATVKVKRKKKVVKKEVTF